MASNLSSIGFSFATEAEFQAAMLRCAEDADAGVDCVPGGYRVWRSRAGAELWFHVAEPHGGETEILGLTPFFEGQSDVQLRIETTIRRPGDNPFEGAFYAWVAPKEAGEGAYPLVFDAVDFAAIEAGPWPQDRQARIAGFARELRAFPDDVSYLQSASSAAEARFSPKAFLPLGLFAAAEGQTAGGPQSKPPSSLALLTGTIADHRILKNEETGQDFHWLLVDSLEATFDILADPSVIEGELIPGGTVEVSCWLFGRLLD